MSKIIEGIIEIDQRILLRSVKKQAKGNPIAALIELVINSNDSYNCIGIDHPGKIEIEYIREDSCVNFAVRDKAVGMPLDKIIKAFTRFGGLTSGIENGKQVGGYFGTGAKAALSIMENGRICTFHEGEFIEYFIWIDYREKIIKWKYHEPKKATPRLRNLHKIEYNGTVAYFASPSPGNPRFATVFMTLSNHYRLRKIIMNPRRKILLTELTNQNKPKSIPLKYDEPEHSVLERKKFMHNYNGYKDFKIEYILKRANIPISQSGVDRQGGLLIVDEYDNPLDITLLKYDDEPLASHFFGEVKIFNFLELLKKEEPVLDQERKGLIKDHPFCASLHSEIEKILAKEIDKEKKRKEKKLETKQDKEEVERHNKAFSIFNEIAEKEILEVKKLGKELGEEAEPPENGLLLYPSRAEVTVGKSYGFQLLINPTKINPSELIEIVTSNPDIVSKTQSFKYMKSGKKVDMRWIVIQPLKADIKGELRASTKKNETSATIFSISEKELLLSEGMLFDPESITLRPNKIRKVRLLVYVKIIPHGSTIKVSSDNPSISISPLDFEVNEYQAERHIQTFELEVWGSKDGEDAIITAEYEGFVALLQAKIRSVEKIKDKGPKGMFSEIFYDPADPLQRSSFSEETGEIHIFYKFPSIKHYIGENLEYKKTLANQVLIADIVAEQCFFTIANKVIERSGVVLEPTQKHIKATQKAYELSKKHGKKIHQVLVNQDLLSQAQAEIEQELSAENS